MGGLDYYDMLELEQGSDASVPNYSQAQFVETDTTDFDMDTNVLMVGGKGKSITRKYGGGHAGAATGTVPYYKSNYIGKKIVYGDTGVQTNHVVGSKDEDLYFKVRLSGRIFFPGEKDYVTLFYDNPRDYCIHYLLHLDKLGKKRRNRETPDMFEKRIDSMLYSMDKVIRVWEQKRNRALADAIGGDDYTSDDDEPAHIIVK
jgi:hypothetical protein